METTQEKNMTEPEMVVEGGWEQPDFGIITMPNALTGKLLMGLQVTTSSTLHRFYLCDSSNYEKVARDLHKLIMDVGVKMRRQESGLVVAEGSLPDGFVRQAERRVKRSAGG